MTRSFYQHVVLLLALGCGPVRDPRGLRVATFQSDVTPPLGHPLCGGWIKPAEVVDAPLLLKGIVIDDGRTRCALAALDWCVLSTKAHDAFRNRIAEGVGVAPRFVSVHCTHTHSAPIADARAQELLDASPQTLPHLGLAWLDRVSRDAGAAAKAAVARPVTHVGAGKAKVENFASNRRVLGPDGKIRVRYSTTKDPDLRAQPEGLIDPWIRTVSFLDGDAPVARLHYYGSHPQTGSGDGRVHGDVVANARQYLEREEGVFQIYFAGCGGNVTAGKYNDGSSAARQRLASNFYSGLVRSVRSTSSTPVSEVEWKSLDLRLPLRVKEEEYRATLADVGKPKQARLMAAITLAWIERSAAGPIDISRLRLGQVDLLHLPGEPFVEYQLYAQSLRPERFTATAGYGEGGPWYVCTDAAYGEGGYEPGASWTGPGVEKAMKDAILEVLMK
jgi:hypothetical protein